MLNLYLAGTETTSSTIRFGLNVLIKYPEIQGRCVRNLSNGCHAKYIFNGMHILFDKPKVIDPATMQLSIGCVQCWELFFFMIYG